MPTGAFGMAAAIRSRAAGASSVDRGRLVVAPPRKDTIDGRHRRSPQYRVRLSTRRSPSRARPPRSLDLDQEAEPDDLAAERLDEPAGRGRRAAGGEHVVDDEDPLAGVDGVAVDLELVGAVLEVVLLADDRPRQLARLADRHEPGPQAVGHRRGEDEAARLDADARGRPATSSKRSTRSSIARPKAAGVAEQRRDVAEHDTGLADSRRCLGCARGATAIRCHVARFAVMCRGYRRRYHVGLPRRWSAALLLARPRRVRQQTLRPVGAQPLRRPPSTSTGRRPRRRPRRLGRASPRRGDPPTHERRGASRRALASVPFVGHFGIALLEDRQERHGDEDRRVGAGDHADQQGERELAERDRRRGCPTPMISSDSTGMHRRDARVQRAHQHLVHRDVDRRRRTAALCAANRGLVLVELCRTRRSCRTASIRGS